MKNIVCVMKNKFEFVFSNIENSTSGIFFNIFMNR